MKLQIETDYFQLEVTQLSFAQISLFFNFRWKVYCVFWRNINRACAYVLSSAVFVVSSEWLINGVMVK